MKRIPIKKLARSIAAAVLGALVLLPVSVEAETPIIAPAPPTRVCENECVGLQYRLERVLAGRQKSGEIVFEGPDTLFCAHPLLATLCLDAYRATGDRPFLQKAHAAIAGHFNYLLVHRDADRDFLVESSPAGFPGATEDLEDVGFNAMLALDMLSLSWICAELERPFDALFWYRGMKTVSAHLLRASFDAEALLFLPTRASSSRREPIVHGLSALPLYFGSEIGEDISMRVIEEHLLNGESRPGDPGMYLRRAEDAPTGRSTAEAELRSLLLLGLLEWNGLFHDARARAAALARPVDEAGEGGDEIARYAACKLRSAGPFAPFPRRHDLFLLDHVVFQKALLEPERIATLRRSVAEIDAYLASRESVGTPPVAEARDAETVGASTREVFFSISLLRDQWKNRTLFSRDDRAQSAGFDLYAAVAALWDDVIETLQRAETDITRGEWRAEGFDVVAELQRDAVAPGESVPWLFRLSSTARDVRVDKLLIYRDQSVDTLWSSSHPIVLAAGGSPREIVYEYPIRGGETSFAPLACSVEARFADGRRARYYFRAGVVVTKPLTCAVTLPRGTILSGGAVPIEVLVRKHVPGGVSIQAQWYSPVGLRPAEGRSLEAWMPENTSEARMSLSVPIPNPCRPGSFPFTLSIFANGEEIGTVSSALFRHYEWLFVGPFTGKRDALDTPYPPETRIDPLETYNGTLGPLEWRILPEAAYADAGKISFGALLPGGSVGFLHTVIETAAERRSAVLFACDSPALLFVNGESVARSDGDDGSQLHRAPVTLRGGRNTILVKVVSSDQTPPEVYFQLGEEEDLMSDEFNNNLWELIDGFDELAARARTRDTETGEVRRQVTITYRNSAATSVAVVGSFNGWSPGNSAMRKNKYGEWEINLYLSPGRYTYRLLVDNSKELTDPASPYTEPDGYGGENSVLYVQ